MFGILKKALLTTLVIVAWMFAVFNASAMLFMVHELLGIFWIIFLICMFVGMYGKHFKKFFEAMKQY